MRRKNSNFRFVISVLAADRVGILRDISSAVSELNGNIDGLSQTVVEGYFTVTLTASFANRLAEDDIRRKILSRMDPERISVFVVHHDGTVAARTPASGDRYILTLTGRDRKGVVKLVTTYLASRKINIEDWFMDMKGDMASYVGEVAIPESLDIRMVHEELTGLLAPTGLRVSLQHENIFRATGEVGPIASILDVNRKARSL